ncbi:TonB-dependent receptor domain-containing protein [Phenylobacterium sp.]|jgi:outer membrane receptor protein involved in Fe transport|uniref:TonB-dependent receptor domain-containing protein n=1 Tax=Phenylobacterium sp. TaxID=1871053 RepID=UPI002F3F52AE
MLCSKRRVRLAAVASLFVLAMATAPCAQAQEVVGSWHGVLVVGANVLRIVVRVKDDGKGGFSGEMVSLDQSPRGIPLSDIKLANGHFSFAIPAAQISFDGQWDAAKSAWSGQFKQGASLPLVLDKGEFPAAPPTPAQAPAAAAKPLVAPPTKTVEGVTVTGQSQAIRTDIDRRSYDITKDLQTTTGSVADVLRNVPSVQVDVQGNVSLRGDPNVTIMIDGKPSSLFNGPSRGQVLQNLPASAFERVEVMTNPSAAFRPDGSAGIINLIPKSAKALGTSGSVRVNVGGAGRDQLGLSGYSAGKTVTLSGDAVIAHDPQSATTKDHRETPDPISGQALDSSQTTETDAKANVAILRGAIDYDPDAKTHWSAELRGTGIGFKSRDDSLFAGETPGTLAPEGFTRLGTTSLDRLDIAATGSWRRKFEGDGHELSASFTQDRSTDRRTRDDTLTGTTPLIPSLAEDIRADITADVSHMKVDYSRPLPGDAKLKAGYELQVDGDVFDNAGLQGPTAAGEVINPALVDAFKFKQAVNGAYVTYQRPFGAVTALAGLRVEDTRIDLHDVTSAFKGRNGDTHLYPSLHLAWKVSDAQQFTASVSERIQRPQPSDYDPFRIFVDPFNFRSGNPDLKPQQTWSYEAGWQYRAGATIYLATAYFRDNRRGVTDVVEDLGGGVLLTTKENLSSSRSGGLELVAAGQVIKNVTVNVSGDLGWTEIDGAALGFTATRSAFTPSVRGVINWQVTPKDLFQIQGAMTAKRLTPQGYYEPSGIVNLGYRRKFNDDWSLFVVTRDALASIKSVLVIDTPALKDRMETDAHVRAVFVGFAYSFGGGRRRDPGFDYGAGAAAAPR